MPITRLTLLCHGSTAATRRAVFPRDEPLDSRGRARAKEAAEVFGKFERAIVSPALRARQTADAIGVFAEIDAGLRDIDYGSWTGSTIEEVALRDPKSVARWRNDPETAPHGGESLATLSGRVAAFLARSATRPGDLLAISHATVLRAAVALALQAPLSAVWRIDIEPLAAVVLHGDSGSWRLRTLTNPRAGRLIHGREG